MALGHMEKTCMWCLALRQACKSLYPLYKIRADLDSYFMKRVLVAHCFTQLKLHHEEYSYNT